jgi:hypothetical protein
MAATLSELQASLDALNAARASGMRSVEYAGRRVEYRSDVEIAAAITALEQQINDAQGSGRVRAFDIISGKGL